MILTILSASHVRLALRVYFIVIMALIAWLAEKVLQARAKLQVIKTRKVPVNRVLGWIQGFDLLKAFFSLRQSPGGKVGYLAMLLVFLLSKGADLMTTFVQQVPVQSRCAFGDGLVFNETGPALFTFPPVNGAPYIALSSISFEQTIADYPTVVHNSQYFSTNNSCQYGIYTKVNRDINFCPEDEDILGTWSCTSGNPLTYDAGYPVKDIAADLENRGLMYSNTTSERTLFGDVYYGHFAIWSSSAASDSSNAVWDVRAAIQENALPEDPVVMLPLACAMYAPSAETIQSQMESVTALSVWTLAFQGLMYYGTGTPAVDDPGAELAMLLNTMVMVYGGNNMLLSVPAPDADQTQGCIVMAAHVPLAVEILVFFVAGSAVGLILLSIIYALILWTKDSVLREAVSRLPDTVVAWAALAAKEHRISKQGNFAGRVRQRELKDWVVGLESVNGERKLRIMPADDIPEERPFQDNWSQRRLLA